MSSKRFVRRGQQSQLVGWRAAQQLRTGLEAKDGKILLQAVDLPI
jgi:hypothetical protein